jgi:2-polyprenyl-6-methoxyphenol hydroxylase-like FAD-dependent oxidoreductase
VPPPTGDKLEQACYAGRMNLDVVVVGGGIGGSTLAAVLSRAGKKVLVLEREQKFKDRVRGENMLPWGVDIARRLGVLDDLVAAGGHLAPGFTFYVMGQKDDCRPLPETTPHRSPGLNMFHPDMQEALLTTAVKAGAEVKRGVNVTAVTQSDGAWEVTYSEGGASHTIRARVVVGADGRSSKMREWGGFQEKRDPNFLRIAGACVERTSVPADSVYFCMGPGVASFIAPFDNGRARYYAIYPGVAGDRKLSGKEKVGDFLAAIREAGVPGEWLDGLEVTGPLAEFEGADHWVPSPAKNGIALIGDAAGATDPSWGCGLSKTMMDVEHLSKRLLESDDWNAALAKYAADHDDKFGKLHDILACVAQLYWTPGPEGDARRMKVIPRMKANPMEYPDPIGVGPFGPSDEPARRRLLGLD